MLALLPVALLIICANEVLMVLERIKDFALSNKFLTALIIGFILGALHNYLRL